MSAHPHLPVISPPAPLTPPREIFRQYDIRGRVEESLTDELTFALGWAFGAEIYKKGGRRVALGRDCRLSGPALMSAFERGVTGAGVDVIQLGVVPTPLVYFALHTLDCDGGVMITGSHNPPQWNGFKLCYGTQALYGAEVQNLRTRIQDPLPIDLDRPIGEVTPFDISAQYLDYVTENIHLGERPLRVVIDAGNGASGPIAEALYTRLGVELIPLYCDPDGRFPNHHPDPTVEANLVDLRAAILSNRADLGVAFDGDGDRVGILDRHGRVIWGDQLMIFFARALLKERPGARVIGEVKCSQTFYDAIRDAGGVGEMWRVGHSLIKARMRETGAPLAGEVSGHIFFADRFFGFDDAAYVGARLIELMSRSPDDLSDWLDALPQQFATPEIRVWCPDEYKERVVQRAIEHYASRYEVITIDGARIQFPEGWGLIRPSNTQPVLVMRFEANTPKMRDELRADVEGWLLRSAPEVDLTVNPDH